MEIKEVVRRAVEGEFPAGTQTATVLRIQKYILIAAVVASGAIALVSLWEIFSFTAEGFVRSDTSLKFSSDQNFMMATGLQALIALFVVEAYFQRIKRPVLIQIAIPLLILLVLFLA